jgi:hypothetical protein
MWQHCVTCNVIGGWQRPWAFQGGPMTMLTIYMYNTIIFIWSYIIFIQFVYKS